MALMVRETALAAKGSAIMTQAGECRDIFRVFSSLFFFFGRGGGGLQGFVQIQTV